MGAAWHEVDVRKSARAHADGWAGSRVWEVFSGLGTRWCGIVRGAHARYEAGWLDG